MRSLLIFIGGFFLGLIISELVGLFGYLLYDQTIGMKFFPAIFGIMLVALDSFYRRKSRKHTYLSF
jgi:Family of unknown function (DUF5957)